MTDDKQKQQGTSSNRPIMVAVIGIVGTLGAAILANWDKVFPPNKPNTPTATSVSPTSATPLPGAKTLKVYADSIKGTPFQNRENTYVQVRFKADPSDK